MAQGCSIGCLHRRLISLRQPARHNQKLFRGNFIRFWFFSTWPGRELGSEEWSSEVRIESGCAINLTTETAADWYWKKLLLMKLTHK